MLTQRKRRCARCGAQSAKTRCFPANLKKYHQFVWVKSLGLSKVEALRELEVFRERVANKEDIRWCEAHFGADGLPIERKVSSRMGQTKKILKDSSFRFSQVSYQSESDTEEEEEEDTTVHSSYFLTAKPMIDMLFRRCQECGALIDPISVQWRQKASALWVTYSCTGCKKHFRWDSQPKRGRGKSRVYEMNQALPVSAFITGLPIMRLIDQCDLLSIAIPKERSMRDTIRFYACISIDRVYLRWERLARDLSKDVAPEEGIVVALDGQFAHPGWTSNNGKVTVFDCALGLAIAAVSLSTKDEEIGGVSCRIETVGSEKALVELVDDGFSIRSPVTDSNASVDKRIRENPKLKGIESKRDFWHAQKSLRKAWWAVKGMKSYPRFSEWYKSFFNHLFYVNKRFPNREDRPLALEYVRSFIKHCTGQHRWRKVDKW
ncbi:hypothetical protein PMAYCL1PPCAC_25514, partial [Pristionchus mayeri]